MANKDINRIKVVLADKKKTNKWLAKPQYPSGVPTHPNPIWGV